MMGRSEKRKEVRGERAREEISEVTKKGHETKRNEMGRNESPGVRFWMQQWHTPKTLNANGDEWCLNDTRRKALHEQR